MHINKLQSPVKIAYFTIMRQTNGNKCNIYKLRSTQKPIHELSVVIKHPKNKSFRDLSDQSTM